MSGIELNQVNHFCLQKQHLTEDSKTSSIIQIVKDIGGLHATGPTTPYLSLFIRSNDFTKDALKKEMGVKWALGKIRSVRRTIYVLTKEMLPVYYQATKKLIQSRFQPFMEYTGIKDKEYQELSELILGILKNKGISTSDIKKALRIDKNVSGIVNLMCDQGLLIRGLPKRGWKSNNHTYFPFEGYFPDVDLNELPEAEARRLLVCQYLNSFGPVTEKDITWWTGLKKTLIRETLKEIERQITYLNISDLEHDFIMLYSDKSKIKNLDIPKKKAVNLLPAQDPYLMGYKERQRYLNYEHYSYIFDCSGNATSTILLDGRAIGVWDLIDDIEPVVKIFFFEKVKKNILSEVNFKAYKIGKFITDKEVQVKECDSMIPLTDRTAGGFMSPLRNCSGI